MVFKEVMMIKKVNLKDMKEKILKILTKKRDLLPRKKNFPLLPGGKSGLSYERRKRRNILPVIIFSAFLASFLGFLAGAVFLSSLPASVKGGFLVPEDKTETPEINIKEPPAYSSDWEKEVVSVVEEASPSVVSILVTKNVAVMEKYYYNPFEEFFGEDFEFEVPRYRQKGTEEQKIGGGTGFIVSRNGLIITNKHLVSDEEADYTVFTNKGEKYEARVLDRDPLQDIAILKIEARNLPVIALGSSKGLKIGQTVIAIGNVLGEFRNSVSVGVVAGLKRSITAVGGGISEQLTGIIQTDAAINQGNSGGPLLNLRGEVVGINTAMALGAENVGFAVPVERAVRDMERIDEFGEIVYPFLGIYYTTVTPALAEEYELEAEYGAWVGRNGAGQETEIAVFEGSPAERIGLQRDDVLLEFGGEKITVSNPLNEIIIKYDPGDEVNLKIFRKGQVLEKQVTLSKREE